MGDTAWVLLLATGKHPELRQVLSSLVANQRLGYIPRQVLAH